MLKDIILLGVGAAFGLGATLVAMAAPFYFPNAPSRVWHWAFWGGLAHMAVMAIDAAVLLTMGRAMHLGPAVLANLALMIFAGAVIWQTSLHETNGPEPHKEIGPFYPKWPDLAAR